MELSSSVFLATLFGMALILVFLALGIVVFRAVSRTPIHSPPITESADGSFEVAGKRVVCSHCGSTSFKAQTILLNTWLLSLLRIDWLDSSATVLSCENCGRLTWFSQDE